MKIGIVAASGTLGALLAESFVLAGHSVKPLTHNGEGQSQAVDVLCDDPDQFMTDVDAIIYLAWATQDRSVSMQLNHASAAAKWAERSSVYGCTFVFTSTVLAASDAASTYGKHKLLAEEAVLKSGGVVLRIGLVADDALPLVLTSIRRQCARFRIAARLLDWPVFPIGSRAFTSVVESELWQGPGARVVWVAPAEPTSLAAVATWNNSPPSASRVGMWFIDRLARTPIRGGRVGKVLDGLAGLTTGPSGVDPAARPPASGTVETASWQQCLRPSQG